MKQPKPTQAKVVLDYLLTGEPITGSIAYKITKARCECASLNLHVIIRTIRHMGFVIDSEWMQNKAGRFKAHRINFWKTPNSVLRGKFYGNY